MMSASTSGINAKRRKLEYGNVSGFGYTITEAVSRTPKFHPKWAPCHRPT